MIRFNCKDYTNCVGDYVKDLEAEYCKERQRADLFQDKYNNILIAFKYFKMFLDDVKMESNKWEK